jgi:UDP-2,4-diacetamido-2,4,6-trideoxy-beta-L-altropyranose hydrolase
MNLLIRADASPHMGTGHIMRCLALGQWCREQGGRVSFAAAQITPALQERLQREGLTVIRLSVDPGTAADAGETAALARQLGASWLVLDGYQFGGDYQRLIKEAGLPLLALDDYGHADHYYADLVLNQNVYAHEGLYATCESYTRLLLGTDYVLLRREFWPWRDWRRETPEVARRVLVTLGGADPDGVTARALTALSGVEVAGLEAVVIAGGNDAHYEELRGDAQRLLLPVQLLRNVPHISELMAGADVAIAAGGTTCWELAFMGLPSLLLILAENQRGNAEALAARGVSRDLGLAKLASPEEIAKGLMELCLSSNLRAEMTRRGQQLVDGQGAARVLGELQTTRLKIRKAKQEDARLLWDWANDPSTRRVSFAADPIPWEEHCRWLQQKLADPDCLFFVVSNAAGTPVGQARYDMNGGAAVISISVAAEHRAQGYGPEMIRLTASEVFNVSSVKVIHAYVKYGNDKSVGAFARAGFRNLGLTRLRDQQVFHLILEK